MENTMNTATTVRNTQRVSILANLLATENLRVMYSATIPSAAFDLKTRTLLLPMWRVGQSVRDFLVGHEIAHAKYTPQTRWLEAAKEIGGTSEKQQRVAQDFINVVEDARIERLIKGEFPGLRKDFMEGYKILHDEMNIFKVKGRDLGTLRLIDRINLYYKIGIHCGVEIPFTAEERKYLDRITATRAGEIGFEDVVEIARELFKREKEEMKDQAGEDSKDQSKQKDQKKSEKNKGNPNGSDGEGEDQDEEEGTEGTGDADGEESEDGMDGEMDGEESEGNSKGMESDEEGIEAEGDSQGNDGSEGSDGEDIGESMEDDTDDGESAESQQLEASETMGAMTSAMANLVDANYDEEAIKINDIDPSKVVVEVADFIKLFDKVEFSPYANGMKGKIVTEVVDQQAQKAFNRVTEENKKAVDAMCKRFEVKRSAKNFAKQTSAKSGRISPRLLSKYKFAEDIFDRVTIKRDEKNHGIVILLDWSGSMGIMIGETVVQLTALLAFCRKCGIPAEVYFFTSNHVPSMNEKFEKENANLPMTKDFNGKMRKMTREECVGGMWGASGVKFDEVNERTAFTDHACNLPQGTTAKGGNAILQAFSLIKVYDQNMDTKKFAKSIGRLILLSQMVGGKTIEAEALVAPKCLSLGNTPLDESILAMRQIIVNFRKSTNTKVTFINLSDGEGTSVINKYDSVGRQADTGKKISRVLIDGKTGRRIDVDRDFNMNAHSSMIQLLKDATGVSVVGIYLNAKSNNRIDYTGVVQRALYSPKYTEGKYGGTNEAGRKFLADLTKQYDDDKFVALQYGAYDMYFVVEVADRDRAKREAADAERKNATLKNQKVAATRNFIAKMKQEQTNRMFINRLMDIVA
jgi:hypothetical protein